MWFWPFHLPLYKPIKHTIHFCLLYPPRDYHFQSRWTFVSMFLVGSWPTDISPHKNKLLHVTITPGIRMMPVLTDGNLVGGESQFHRMVILSWLTLQPYTSEPPSVIFHAIVRALSERWVTQRLLHQPLQPGKKMKHTTRQCERELLIIIIIMTMTKERTMIGLNSSFIHMFHKGFIRW